MWLLIVVMLIVWIGASIPAGYLLGRVLARRWAHSERATRRPMT